MRTDLEVHCDQQYWAFPSLRLPPPSFPKLILPFWHSLQELCAVANWTYIQPLFLSTWVLLSFLLFTLWIVASPSCLGKRQGVADGRGAVECSTPLPPLPHLPLTAGKQGSLGRQHTGAQCVLTCSVRAGAYAELMQPAGPPPG